MNKAAVMFAGCIVVVLLSIFVFAPLTASAAGAVDACVVLTKADAESLFNAKISSQKADKTRAPAGNMCSYFFKIKGGTYSIKAKISSSEEIKAEGIFTSARDVFDRQKKARMANEDMAKKLRNIPAIGEEAFWTGYDLWVVKANYVFVLLAHPYLAGSYASSQAMENAREQQNLNYTRNLANMILLKMK